MPPEILVRSTLVVSSTVLLYDFLCTLDQEIAYVWSNPRSFSSMLFFINRYVPFIDTFLSLALKFSIKQREKCLMYYTIVTWLIILGTIFSEVILMLRTYAIWERNRVMRIFLSFLAALILIPGVILTAIEIHSLNYSRKRHGCHLVHASPVILAAYLLLVLSETILVVLTTIKAYKHFRHSQAGWVRQLYKDGILFYFYILAISLANIIVPFVAPTVFANWLASPQRVVHSILCNRVLFLIFRQRSVSSMTNRLSPDSDSDILTELHENDTNMNMVFFRPTLMSIQEDESGSFLAGGSRRRAGSSC